MLDPRKSWYPASSLVYSYGSDTTICRHVFLNIQTAAGSLKCAAAVHSVPWRINVATGLLKHFDDFETAISDFMLN
jgi:hypothetical protein